MTAVSSTCFFTNSIRALRWGLLSNGFFLATCAYRPALCRDLLIVDVWTLTPISDTDLCRSLKVIVGFRVTSQTSFLLARLLSLGGRPDLGSVWVVWCIFHFLMMDFTVLRGIISAFWNFFVSFSCSVPLYHFIPDLFRKLLGLHGCFVGSLCELQLESLYIPEGNYLQVKPLWVHTGWNHFTNFVTFQTNHLPLSWFRAAVAKGLNTYATEINQFFSVNLTYLYSICIF